MKFKSQSIDIIAKSLLYSLIYQIIYLTLRGDNTSLTQSFNTLKYGSEITRR